MLTSTDEYGERRILRIKKLFVMNAFKSITAELGAGNSRIVDGDFTTDAGRGKVDRSAYKCKESNNNSILN